MNFKKKIYKFLNQNRNYIQLLKSIFIISLIILAGAIGIMAVELKALDSNIHNFFDALWWALVTITTVGYGDIVPTTFWGRIIGIIFIFMGFIIFSTFTAFIASTFVDRKIKEMKGLNKIKFKNHIIICGWNNSAHKMLEFLNSKSEKFTPDIVLVNELEEGDFSTLQNHFPGLQPGFIKGDFTNQDIINKANIKEAEHVIILYDESKPNTPPSDERTIIAAHNIAYMTSKAKISLQLQDEKYLSNLREDKIKNVIIYNNLGGTLLAQSTLNPSIPDFMQEILNNNQGYSFAEKSIPQEFIQQEYRLLKEYFQKQNLILLGIVSIAPKVSIEKLVSDDTSNIDQFIKQQFELSGKKLKDEKVKSNIKIKPEDDYLIQETDRAIVL